MSICCGESAVEVPRTVDDVRSIQRDCRTVAEWQSQLLQSLIGSGWSLQMCCWVRVADPASWFELLTRTRLDYWSRQDPAFEVEGVAHEAARLECGADRDRWLTLCLRTLEQRGWSRTMMETCLQYPRTNIIRRLDSWPAGSSEADETGGESWPDE